MKPSMMEHGRAIARALNELKVEKRKSMAKAVERREKLLHTAAEQALSGNSISLGYQK